MAPEPEYYRPVPLNDDPGRAGYSRAPHGQPFGGQPFGGGGRGAPYPGLPVVNVVGGKSVVLAYVLWLFLGWLGTVTSSEHNEQKWAEVEVRSLTGHGVAEAVDH